MIHDHAFRVTRRGEGKGGFRQEWRSCRCGMQERRRYSNDQLVQVRFKLPHGMDWIDPVAFLKIRLGVILCPWCDGDDPQCRRCAGLGVVSMGGAIPGTRPEDGAK